MHNCRNLHLSLDIRLERGNQVGLATNKGRRLPARRNITTQCLMRVQARPRTTVARTKQKLETVRGLPAAGQRLYNRGVLLDNARSLAECGIGEGSEVLLHMAHAVHAPCIPSSP